jgi:tetratricopeptide (TPR) repeat protein
LRSFILDIDPNQDTIPNPAVAAPPASPLARFLRSTPGAFLILALFLGTVITLSVLGGYRAGLAERGHAAATAQVEEIERQYKLGVEDMNAGRYLMAAQRFEYIVNVNPNYLDAASRLAQTRAALNITPAPPATATPSPTLPATTSGLQTAPALYAEAKAAFDAGDWDAALQKLKATQATDPGYESGSVRNMLFNAYRNRGIESINAGVMELGLTDLDQAAKLGPLDEEAQQYQNWAAIYISGVSYWGLNWAQTVETFQLLYTLAPYFRDTITRLHDAHLGYAGFLEAGGDPCGAALEYTAALEINFDQPTEDKRAAAQLICDTGTPTPDPTLFTATPDGTLTPFPTLDGSATATATATETAAP